MRGDDSRHLALWGDHYRWDVGGLVAQDGSQNPRVWIGQDGEARASYEITARTVKFLGKREGNGGAPIGEPPPGGEDEDLLPF